MNWKNEIEKRKMDIYNDLISILEINSEFDETTRSEDAPFGQGPKDALIKFLSIAERDGFTTKNVDNYAGHIEFGEGKETFGILGHLDVVPAGSGWTNDPYTPTLIDGKLFGRGTQDDKGPVIASYYALKIIKELGLPISKKIRLIVGTDEEIGSRCIDHYFKTEPMPDFGVSPDAAFPVIYSEKGITDLIIDGNINDDFIIEFAGGLKSNMVPESATVTVNQNLLVHKNYFENFVHSMHANADISFGEQTTFTIYGKSAHSSTPEHGVNALSIAAEFLYNINPSPLTNFLVKYFTSDIYGVKIGWNYGTSESGVLTSNLSIVDFKNNKLHMLVNTRIPQGFAKDSKVAALTSKLSEEKLALSFGKEMDPLYVDPNDKLIQTLYKAYQDVTGDEIAKPLVMGGATYAHSLNNMVAFGMLYPQTVDRMHQLDEYVEMDELYKSIEIFCESFYNLAK